ncbi:5'/3'-nucleotidase SurE [Niveispirillum sp. SYP-B3756]|uniref:5'/3'-nucleotidase SurE n=1 Tax=Niveispirillum sp. SYP-B3756 TaxID=2662178 RepID=UPI001FFEC4A0|nr:5'/3'-nucleotidase SurE [Niveispirillum sp. SYP-B3756]
MFNRALLTNDDGIDAPGLAALAAAVAPLAREIWVVAPEHDQSGVSRALSLYTPLRLYPRGERRFAVSGTPSDCVAMALRVVMADNPPDIVFSGINRGANLADEVGYSGTVSGAMMARLLGVPSYAVSQAWRDRENVRWHTAIQALPAVVRRFGPAPRTVLNVNFPDLEPDELTGLSITRQGQPGSMSVEVEQRSDTRGYAYHWLALRRRQGAPMPDGSDIAALRRGEISVCPLGFDFTDEAMLEELRAAGGV